MVPDEAVDAFSDEPRVISGDPRDLTVKSSTSPRWNDSTKGLLKAYCQSLIFQY